MSPSAQIGMSLGAKIGVGFALALAGAVGVETAILTCQNSSEHQPGLRGRFTDEMIASLQSAAPLKPDTATMHLDLAQGWMGEGHSVLALPEFKRAHEIAPDNVPIAAAYANALDAVHRYDEAVQVFQNCVSLSGNDPNVMMGYANVLYHAGRKDDTIKVLEDILARNPGFAPAAQNLNALKAQLGTK